MQSIVAYNESEIKEHASKDDLRNGYNVWLDLVDPTSAELHNAQQSFNLDPKAVEMVENKSKKPQIRVLNNHKFTIILEMKFKDAATLHNEAIYIFSGRGWLVTIHSKNIDLRSKVLALFEERNKPIMESSIDALYYSILSNIVDSYEQLLTAIELSITEFEQRSLYRPTRKMLEHLDSLSRQIIILRRHFWHTRDIINFLTHTEENKDDVKYLRIVYDDINQLIELTESYRETLNSTRELYIANVSLQMNDTVKTLTIFSAVLLPLTFIAGLFGMNGIDLNDIQKIPVGFMIIMIIMGLISAGLLVFFKRKEWIFVKEGEVKLNHAVKGRDKADNHKDDASSTSSNEKVAKYTKRKIQNSEVE